MSNILPKPINCSFLQTYSIPGSVQETRQVFTGSQTNNKPGE